MVVFLVFLVFYSGFGGLLLFFVFFLGFYSGFGGLLWFLVVFLGFYSGFELLTTKNHCKSQEKPRLLDFER